MKEPVAILLMFWSTQLYAFDLEDGETVVSDGKVVMATYPAKR